MDDRHPEPLLERAVHGALSEQDRAELEAHLLECPACALEYNTRAAFEMSASDSVLERRAVAAADAVLRTMDEAAKPPARIRPRRTLLMVAASLALTVTAAAAVVSMVPSIRETFAPKPRPAVQQQPTSQPIEPVVETAPGDSTDVAVEIPGDAPAQPTQPHEPKASPKTPAELLSAASEVRRLGDLGTARRRYAILLKLHPASKEAQVARIQYAQLLLGHGKNQRAATLASAYLSRSPRGTLAEEALVVLGTAYEALGDAPEERTAWERLINEHPTSLHRSRAERRLRTLR